MFLFEYNFTSRAICTLCVFTFFVTLCGVSAHNFPARGSKSLHEYQRPIIIYPKVRFKRSLTDSSKHKSNNDHDLQIQFNHDSEEFAIYLRKNEHLVTAETLVEWHYPNGTKQLSKLNDNGNHKKDGINKNKTFKNENTNAADCLFIGEVIGGVSVRGTVENTSRVKSVAAIDVCDGGYRGYLQIGKDGYIIRPLREHEIFLNNKSGKEEGSASDNGQFTTGSNAKDFKR